MDVHPPHHAIVTWREFFVHMATIVLGLLIAIGLEQGVEWLHHLHQRHQLQEDLRGEAETNEQVIERNLKMQDLEPWFADAVKTVDAAKLEAGKVQVLLPRPPCIAGSLGTAALRYFAPSEAVWMTAKESGLVVLLPVEESRMYARLEHNYVLLGIMREDVFDGCQKIVGMRQRFAQPGSGAGGEEVWTMTPQQAEELAKTAVETQTAIKGLLFRLRWSKVYEEGIVRGESKADVKMMAVNQEQYEDAPEH